jgi:hypothetical protein
MGDEDYVKNMVGKSLGKHPFAIQTQFCPPSNDKSNEYLFIMYILVN